MSRGPPLQMTDEEIVKIIQKHPDRAVTATEVAEESQITKQRILDRLDQLATEGRVAKKKVGARAVVWWRAGD